MKKVHKDFKLCGELTIKHIRNGKLLKEYKVKMGSWSRWASRYWHNMTIGVGSGAVDFSPLQLKGINGTLYSVNFNAALKDFTLSNWIVLGTSDAAWSYEQYGLQALKQAANSHVKLADTSETDGTITHTLRGVINVTSSWTAKEAGLYGEFVESGSAHITFLVSRDVLTTPIPVISGDVLLVDYTITIVGY